MDIKENSEMNFLSGSVKIHLIFHFGIGFHFDFTFLSLPPGGVKTEVRSLSCDILKFFFLQGGGIKFIFPIFQILILSQIFIYLQINTTRICQ